jgi:hypothetical protein
VDHVNAADWIVVGEFAIAVSGLVAFVGGYVASSRGGWRYTPEGRHMVNFRGSLAVFMLMALVHNLFPSYPGLDAVRIVVIGWFALAVLQGCALLYRAQSRRRLELKRERQAAATGRGTSAPSS